MLSEILLSFLPYAFVTGFTPGPNNILALNTISNNGWQKGKSMIVGISAGFVCVMIICALGCFGLSKFIHSYGTDTCLECIKANFGITYYIKIVSNFRKFNSFKFYNHNFKLYY
ncbi:hypothetical protein ACTPDI_07490 [Clostridioides difficile]